MSFECQALTAWVSIQELSPLGNVNKKIQYKNIQLGLGRDEYDEIILRLDLGKIQRKFMLREIQIFKKFVKEGKATVRMPDQKLQLMLSNCPPDKLILFLKTMTTKLQCKKKTGFTSVREKLRAGVQKTFQEISPLTVKDLRVAQGLSPIGKGPKCSHTTPNAKRKATEANKENQHPSKKACTTKSSVSQRVILHPLKLTKEQMRVLDMVIRGESLFFTGSAGTGKSFLLRRILGSLAPDHTFATASTGVAACQIGGITLHSFAGIGSGKGTIEACAELAKRPGVMQHWKTCRHLIIDEISMVDGEFFDKMECVARMIRGNDKPFGGIQLIVCGDFLQLPPVTKKNEKRKFCFQSRAWRKCIRTNLELTEVKRQDDKKFIQILQNIRKGRCPDFVVSALVETATNRIQIDGIQATRLCTHKEDVDFINTHELNALNGIGRCFTASCNNEYLSDSSSDHCPVTVKLELKLGTQVMVTKNIDVSKGLVNGARGVITAFEKGTDGWPIVKFMSGTEHIVKPVRWVTRSNSTVLVWKQLPLKLAWAISIHKSQGMTLDCVEMSLSRVFESGQAYVALSRAKSLKGLKVLDFDKSCVRADPDVLKFYSSLELCNPDKENQMDGFFS